jgi:hypothetical protein
MEEINIRPIARERKLIFPCIWISHILRNILALK